MPNAKRQTFKEVCRNPILQKSYCTNNYPKSPSIYGEECKGIQKGLQAAFCNQPPVNLHICQHTKGFARYSLTKPFPKTDNHILLSITA